MELKLNGYTLREFNTVDISLEFDALGDTFSFSFDWEPTNALHKQLFKPLSYNKCTITHGGVLVMTGTVLSHKFGSAGDPPKQLLFVSGYSVAGVLEDSCVLNLKNKDSGINVLYPGSSTVAIADTVSMLQNVDLQTIAFLVTSWYGIKVNIDSELLNDSTFNAKYTSVPIKPDVTVGKFLNDLCVDKNVVLTHNAKGEVLITRVKANQLLTTSITYVREDVLSTPQQDVYNDPGIVIATKTTKATDRAILHDFVRGDGSYINAELEVNGQAMHKYIQVVGQQGDNPDHASDTAIENNMVSDGVTRYTRVIQETGDPLDTPQTARQLLSEELKNITLTIETDTWTLGGNLITPRQMITITDNEIYMYKKTKFFIRAVRLTGDEKEQRATLTCVVPECYNTDPIKNIFA